MPWRSRRGQVAVRAISEVTPYDGRNPKGVLMTHGRPGLRRGNHPVDRLRRRPLLSARSPAPGVGERPRTPAGGRNCGVGALPPMDAEPVGLANVVAAVAAAARGRGPDRRHTLRVLPPPAVMM